MYTSRQNYNVGSHPIVGIVMTPMEFVGMVVFSILLAIGIALTLLNGISLQGFTGLF